jgi:hypothetical protein
MDMVVLNKDGFRLPRVEPQTWGLLLRLGLEYNRTTYMYRVANCNNIEKLIDTLSEILQDKNISFTQTCLVCKKAFSCQDCNYIETCTTKNLPFHCVCPTCLKEGKAAQENPTFQ